MFLIFLWNSTILHYSCVIYVNTISFTVCLILTLYPEFVWFTTKSAHFATPILCVVLKTYIVKNAVSECNFLQHTFPDTEKKSREINHEILTYVF